jgi:2-dehydro-3-deoxygluconokinase
MLRLTPEGSKVIEQVNSLNMYPAGCEMNVAVAASRLGLSVSYITSLASNPLGRFIYNKCREQGVDTGWIKWSKYRQGLYFFENGTPPRPGIAYYDRENSAFSRIEMDDFEWESILKNTRVFFTSGINPSLNRNVNNITLNAVKTARKMGKIVAFDINYRSKLWGYEEARKTIKDYLPFIDILFTSASDAEYVLNIKESPGEEMVKKIAEEYCIPTISLIYRPEKEKDSIWKIICLSDGNIYTAEQRGELVTVDRLGAGDAFAGGFLTGYLESGPELGVNLGNVLITMNNTYSGDICWITREQAFSFLKENNNLVER